MDTRPGCCCWQEMETMPSRSWRGEDNVPGGKVTLGAPCRASEVSNRHLQKERAAAVPSARVLRRIAASIAAQGAYSKHTRGPAGRVVGGGFYFLPAGLTFLFGIMTTLVQQKVKQRAEPPGTLLDAAWPLLLLPQWARLARPLRPAPPLPPPLALHTLASRSPNGKPRQPAARPHWLRERSKFHEGTPTPVHRVRAVVVSTSLGEKKNLPGD